MPNTLVTTYRHDYVDPKEMALSVTLANASGAGSKPASPKPCECIPADEAAAVEASSSATSAPVSITSPTNNSRPTDDDTENDDRTCEPRNPHKYLETIANVYPLLFDDLKRMNKDDLQSILNTDRMRSTYQHDFGRMTEFPVYDDSGAASDAAKDAMIEQFRLELRDPCGEAAVFKDRGTRIRVCGYRPPFRVNVCAKHCSVSQRDQAERRTVVQSEYAANTSKLGDTIMRVNLHSHSKCKPSRCVHEIRYSLLDK